MPDSPEKTPLVSIITPVYNGQDSLDRAIGSVVAQTFADWEQLIIDDCSTDATGEIIAAWAAGEPRIRPLRNPENLGPSAAQNLGIRHARGEFLCYLDHDDEYLPDYLAEVARLRDKGDVLVFCYDVIEDDRPNAPPRIWDPRRRFPNIFVAEVTIPLGVAHRRALIEASGGYNERIWHNADGELWKTFARMGANFVFLPLKSGRYHIRAASHSRTGRPTRQQRAWAEANYRAGRPIFAEQSDGGGRDSHSLSASAKERESSPAAAAMSPPAASAQCLRGTKRGPRSRQREIRKIAFASPHCLIDYYNGAAIATLHALQLLQSHGFQCRAFCGTQIDAPQEVAAESLLARKQVPYQERRLRIGDYDARMLSASDGQVPISVFAFASSRGVWQHAAEIPAFLRSYESFLEEDRPDAVITYGGSLPAMDVMAITKKHDIPIVFALHNCEYRGPGTFQLVDYVTVPSEFCRRHYWDAFGLACMRLPNVIDWQRATVSERQPRFVTYVNPHPNKGVFVFSRIAEVLAQRRPDIPLLVVESRSQRDLLAQAGLDFGRFANVHWMGVTADPREFYRVTKFVLMPSLWNEVFPLVPAEAMLNGIPVIGSNRGGLPETVGAGGVLLDIPSCYTPATRIIPSAEEVAPWVETIIRLWDDEGLCHEVGQRSLQEAQRWHPDRIAPAYSAFFRGVCHQPGPPVVLRSE